MDGGPWVAAWCMGRQKLLSRRGGGSLLGVRTCSCRISCSKISVTRLRAARRSSPHLDGTCCQPPSSGLTFRLSLPFPGCLLVLVCLSVLGWVWLGLSVLVLVSVWCDALLGGRPFRRLGPSSSARPRVPLLGLRLGWLFFPVCLRRGASGTLLCSFLGVAGGWCWFRRGQLSWGACRAPSDPLGFRFFAPRGAVGPGWWVPLANSPAFWGVRAGLVLGP